jgi:hypothetical protein
MESINYEIESLMRDTECKKIRQFGGGGVKLVVGYGHIFGPAVKWLWRSALLRISDITERSNELELIKINQYGY